jgi:PAS domain S-box-containing protein
VPLVRQLLRSIQLSPIATLITDYQNEDNPIVRANSAFCELTGYPEQELIGRNCRLLGGSGTEPEQKRILREAIASGQPALAELTNYKKDGSPFCNAVMIAPVRDLSGDITHYIGSQMEVRRGSQPDGPRRQHVAALIASLTVRQSQVLGLMAQGLRNREIAANLGIKEVTVKLHRSILMEKLGARTPGDAVRIAMEAEHPVPAAGLV